MKKFAFLLLILTAGINFTAPAFAEDEQAPQEPRMRQEEGRDGMQGKGMKGDKKMGMGMHQQPVMTATSDGGVVVFMGGKLSKYDASLTLVKEIELKGGPKPTDNTNGWKEMPQAPTPQEEPMGQMPADEMPMMQEPPGPPAAEPEAPPSPDQQ